MTTDPTDLDLSAVPLFPLPGVVLFPRAVLPLHIFEDRYRTMTADALAGARLIAMAQLKPGWEKHYYSRPAIEPVVCVGRILTCEKLPDGKYNFLLQGLLAGRIEREFTGKPYRTAMIEPLPVTHVAEADLQRQRGRLIDLFLSTRLGVLGAGRPFRELVKSDLPTGDVAHLAAFTFLEDAILKQSLLEEIDTVRRIDRTIVALEGLVASLPKPTAAEDLENIDPQWN